MEPAVGNSSQAIQKPPDPSAAMDEPCEYVEPGTSSTAVGATDAAPVGSVATWIGEVTPSPLHEPKCDQET